MLAVYKKELRQYFNSMIGFAFLAFFLAIVGIYTWGYNLVNGLGNFEVTLGNIAFMFVLLVPIITMRIVAEENHQKTNQLLYTAPVSVTKIILGKYFAVLTLFSIGMAVISLYPLIICLYGSDVRLSMAYSSIIGFYLLGAACIAIGMFISSLTESQAIAAVVSFITFIVAFLMESIRNMLPTDALSQCILLMMFLLIVAMIAHHMTGNKKITIGLFVIGTIVIWAIYFIKSSLYEGLIGKILSIFAISVPYDDFSLGILNYDSILYYVSAVVLFLFFTIQLIKSQQSKTGTYSSVLMVLVISIVVVCNAGFSKFEFSTDLSSGSLFTLSKETKAVMKNMDCDITIYYMVQEGEEITYIDNVLKQYKKVSDHISVKKIDPVVNPGFADSKGIDEEIASDDVIVVNEENGVAKYIANTDMCYSQQDYTTGSYSSYLDVEGQVTSAIQNVSVDDKPKMYLLTKHSEQSIGDSLSEVLDKMNIETEELELATMEGVPEDCDILLINGAATDITDAETERIIAYLKDGGAAMINLTYTTEKTPNLEKILKEYGIVVEKGIICEGRGNYLNSVNNIIPSVTGNSEILSDLSGYIIFPNASGLSQAESDLIREDVTITNLLDTSEDSFVKVDPSTGDATKTDEDIDGPFSVGLSVVETLEDDKESKLIVYSSAYAFSESLTGTSQIENANLFKKSVSSLTTTSIEEVSIDKKDLSYSYISITPAAQILWAAIIILIIPGGLLITGFVIWFIRRRK